MPGVDEFGAVELEMTNSLPSSLSNRNKDTRKLRSEMAIKLLLYARFQQQRLLLRWIVAPKTLTPFCISHEERRIRDAGTVSRDRKVAAISRPASGANRIYVLPRILQPTVIQMGVPSSDDR